MAWPAMVCQAPAKLNLTLSVLGRRADGYHDLQSLMQQLELADTLTIMPLETAETGTLSLTLDLDTSLPELAPEISMLSLGADNLIQKAYAVFSEAIGCPLPALSVRLKKVIPMQAGLGGGSSDAAAMLRYLNQHSDKPLSNNDLQQLGKALGADVPFFLQQEPTAVVEGLGDIIHPRPALPATEVLLFKPRWHGVSTPDAFQAISPACPRAMDAVIMLRNNLLTVEDLNRLMPSLQNDFQAYVLKTIPMLGPVFEGLQQAGFCPLLTGSGSASFVLFSPSQEMALKASLATLNVLDNPDWWVAWSRFNQASDAR